MKEDLEKHLSEEITKTVRQFEASTGLVVSDANIGIEHVRAAGEESPRLAYVRFTMDVVL